MSGTTTRHPLDRISYHDGPDAPPWTSDDRLDEVVLTGVTLHIERMSWHDWWFCADKDGEQIDFYAADLQISDQDGFSDLVQVREPLLGCDVEWGKYPRFHRCERTKPNHRKHVCECGERP